MQVQRLGHVVLKVQDAQRAEAFYAGTLGIPIISRISNPVRMTFFTLGDHHDFAVVELGDRATSPAELNTGLAHVAFKIGDTNNEYQAARSELEGSGVEILYEADRAFTKSIHVHDPDGNEVELYIDTSDTRRPHPPSVS